MEKEEDVQAPPAQEAANEKELPDPVSPAKPAKDSEDTESVRFLHGVLGIFTRPEIGPETEEEVKTRRELNEVVHRMLILGLALSTTALFIGLALSAIKHQPVPSKVSDFLTLYHGLERASPPSILSLGILLLIATPVLRVVGSLIEFILKRDWRFTVITAAVLLILGVSLFFGKG